MNTTPALAPVICPSTPSVAIKIAPARFELFLNVFVRKPLEEARRNVPRKSAWNGRAFKAAA